MSEYDPGRYGHAVGDYDALYPGVPANTAAAVDLLAELAKAVSPRAVLEFGIGTGRLALPLAAMGLTVAGIDGSADMVARLRAKPGGDAIEIWPGDYRTTVGRLHAFSLVVLALNGIFDPRGLDAQLDIFRNAADHLVPGGFFAVETWVMHDRERSGDWTAWPRFVGDDHVEFQLARYDAETNSISRTLVHLTPSGNEFVSVTDTYASPGELDVMAAVTGFHRVARYSSWQRDVFTATSSNCISIYRRSGAEQSPYVHGAAAT